jgi:hypothetical protein
MLLVFYIFYIYLIKITAVNYISESQLLFLSRGIDILSVYDKAAP